MVRALAYSDRYNACTFFDRHRTGTAVLPTITSADGRPPSGYPNDGISMVVKSMGACRNAAQDTLQGAVVDTRIDAADDVSEPCRTRG